MSEKAPTCPSCGVEIAGKITRCKNCGEIYFIEDGICPACHTPYTSNNANPYRNRQLTGTEDTIQQPAPKVEENAGKTQKPADASNNAGNRQPTTGAGQPKQKGKGYATIIVAFIFATIVCGALFYFYNRAQSDKETEDYEFAMRSTDPDVLQQYLLRYADAPAAHRDSIQSHLLLIQKADEEWHNAVFSNSRSALQQYIDKNPQSIHCREALNKIDSLDWVNASRSDSQQLIEEYIKMHADGKYIDDANELLAKIKRGTVQPDEKSAVTSLFRQFFQSINARNESSLLSTVGFVLESFLGKQDATQSDVLQFMHKIYKDDISNLNWRIDNSSFKIDKREVAEGEYEYTVTFSVNKETDRSGNVTTENYRVNGMVSSEGKISKFSLTKIE